MSNRSAQQEAASRAEARRRARLAARGLDPEEASEEDPDEPPVRRGGGLLGRIFPPAAPLPGRPDPFANFRYAGPLRPVVGNLYLLARNPLSWVLPGLVWAAARLLPGSPFELIASLVSFGVLIAAGWFGWQRPSLFGAAAGALGYLAFLLAIAFAAPALYAFVPPEAVLVNGILYTGLGLISGWYGGYLRRRQAQVSSEAQRSRRRR
jgi:hypothetical protein